MAKQIKVLIADDQVRMRQSLKALLRTLPQVTGIEEATNGREAISQVEAFQPDVVVIDIRMPEMDGLQATRVIKNRWPAIGVIVLSMYGEYVAEVRAVGADAFVSKGEPPETLLITLATLMTEEV